LVVERFAKVIGMPTTCGALFSKLAYVGRSPLEQIQLAFGDESIATPERYLGREAEPGGRRLRPAGQWRLTPNAVRVQEPARALGFSVLRPRQPWWRN
jgi:hypothetical protein